jgi:polyisoprenoid-binding protein YceI
LQQTLVLILFLTLAAAAGPHTYTLDPQKSSVKVHVGKSGLLKGAGHEHEVAGGGFRGSVVADEADLSRSSVEVTWKAAELRVTGTGEPAKDVPEVQEAMVGPRVLDAVRFPEITFRSRAVTGSRVSPGVYDLKVTGELALHGVTRELVLPMRVELTGETLTATGRATLEQTAYGIQPVTAAGGLVKTKNAVEVEYRLVGTRR